MNLPDDFHAAKYYCRCPFCKARYHVTDECQCPEDDATDRHRDEWAPRRRVPIRPDGLVRKPTQLGLLA